jgi:hypothetical protein
MAATNETISYEAFRAEMQEELSEEEAAAYVATAARLYHDDGTIEVDDNAVVQPASDFHGAFVMAWVWVDDEQVKQPEKG